MDSIYLFTKNPVPGLGDRYNIAYKKLGFEGEFSYLCRLPKSIENLKMFATELNIPVSISWNDVCDESGVVPVLWVTEALFYFFLKTSII